ncbi:MAG: leucine-rich repeat domain-containing protein [Mycoplasmoidaceae bacterium]|nr:leucine-rich repeat domain-containing protein [Mycoplasmoidaceae bacterium]
MFYCDTTAGDNTVKIKGFNYSSNPQTGLSDASIKKLIAEIKQNQTASSADITFPATIKCSGVDCRVTEIGGFGNADQEPYFPESVKRISFANINGLSIGKGAFARVTGLTNIAFNNNDTGHTTIGQNAFAGCTGLERLNLPEGVQFAQGVDGG